MLAHWRMHGLIGDTAPAIVDVGTPLGQQTAGDASAAAHDSARWHCRIRDLTVSFSVERADDISNLRTLFQPFEVDASGADLRLDIARRDGAEWILHADGDERIRTAESALLLGAVHQAILERLHPQTTWLALIHGGAIARSGNGVALAAPSGSGKTTLIAYLAANGFDYLADDLIALGRPHGDIVPWPMPMSIKPGSVEVLSSRYPELARAPTYRTKTLDARLLPPQAGAWERSPVRLSCVVFPEFRAGSPAQMVALTPFEALQRLLADRIWIGYPLTEANVQAFLDLLDRTPAFALTYEDLADAARHLGEHLQ